MGECSPSVDPPLRAYGGLLRKEAIMLLRRFYVQENQKGGSPPVVLDGKKLTCFKPQNRKSRRIAN